jgi:hypothetical protein
MRICAIAGPTVTMPSTASKWATQSPFHRVSADWAENDLKFMGVLIAFNASIVTFEAGSSNVTRHESYRFLPQW